MVQDGHIFIARRGPHAALARLWEFPGGKMEPGETPQGCLAREMREEFGIGVRIGDQYGVSRYPPHEAEIELIAYWTYWITGRIEAHEHDMVRWVTFGGLSQFEFAPADQPFVSGLVHQRCEAYSHRGEHPEAEGLGAG